MVGVFGGRVGWSVVGGLLGGWVAVVSCEGECFRVCGRWSCYCLWYNSSILFSPLYNRPALAKFEYETTHLFAAVLLSHGGWVGWWVDRLVGGWVCRAVRGWCFIGDLEAGDMLMRLLRCVLLHFLDVER